MLKQPSSSFFVTQRRPLAVDCAFLAQQPQGKNISGKFMMWIALESYQTYISTKHLRTVSFTVIRSSEIVSMLQYAFI